MMVFGKDCYVFDSVFENTSDVEPFDPSLGVASSVPIVDAALAYDCPFTGKTYILVARNVLYIKHMNHNLVPPFIMRETGITVNDVPKMHIDNPRK